jgi:aspartate/tyrosine/aromatic aminotransferase
MEQWAGISAAMKAKGIVPFMDCAYQGFASGDTCCKISALEMSASATL